MSMSETLAGLVTLSGKRTVRPLIMGILNVTPDSFSDGGLFLEPEAALRHAEKLLEEGADVIDVGGASSRPGATDVPLDVELSRITPVVSAITSRFPTAYLSIDTRNAVVAAEMLARGARMINDISGGVDPQMFEVVANAGAAYVVMHMQGDPKTMHLQPRYRDVVTDVRKFLSERVAEARRCGIAEVWCDPGFGFGKSINHNYELLGRLSTFANLGAPLLVGVSRKSMFWKPLRTEPNGVVPATSAAHLWALASGATMLRVHDVRAAKQVVAVGEALGLY